eukprot:TRINITY_DN24755_c0_g1_i2.p1 TRINITY_DN24755_c0_g1~~TRINITY_DN24755_c0_g1_i2.p1  ORF type:complete len:312 (-),score=42.04 TRINITY_DN24755_c0_g1_i2:129-1064(-)
MYVSTKEFITTSLSQYKAMKETMKKSGTSLNGLLFISDINGNLRICEVTDCLFAELFQVNSKVCHWDLTSTHLACAVENTVILYSLRWCTETQPFKEIHTLRYEDKVDFVQLLDESTMLLIVTKGGKIEVIELSDNNPKRMKCNKRQDVAALSFNVKELIYMTEEGSIGLYSLKENKEVFIKLPFESEDIYGLWKSNNQIIIRKRNCIQVAEYKETLILEIKYEIKGSITAVAVTKKSLAYASLNEAYISLIELPSLKPIAKIRKEFEAYVIEIAENHLIALGVNTFAIYPLNEEQIKFKAKLVAEPQIVE